MTGFTDVPAATAVSKCTGAQVVAWTENGDIFRVKHTLITKN